MELTKTAEEMLVSAQMLRLSANQHKSLCVEHLFYGLLALSRYLDSPMNKPQFEQEGKIVRALLTPHIRSIESAANQLKQDAAKSGVVFSDAAPYIGRASEIAENAGKQSIDALAFAAAILEKPTPEIQSLYAAYEADFAKLDAKYPVPAKATVVETATEESLEKERLLREVQQAAQREQEQQRLAKEQIEKERLEEEKLKKEKLDKEKRDREAARQEQQHSPSAEQSEKKPTTSELNALLALLVAYEVENHAQSKHGVQKRKGKKPKRYTKLGAFTYRGGAFAAGLQYFLFGLLVPLGLIYLLDRFTGVFSNPPTLFITFLIYSFIVFWMYYILRGVILLIGRANLPLQHFLDLIAFGALLFGFARAFIIAYNLYWMPTWLKSVLCAVWLLTLLFGASMFPYLVDQQDMTKTRILFQNVEGTPSMIFFRFLTKQLILPLLIAGFFWIFPVNAPDWLMKVFGILAFFWVWHILFTMWQCVNLRYEASDRVHRGKVFAAFMLREQVLALPFALVFFLYWLFGWFPMQAWVIAVIGVYGFIWLGLSLFYLLWLIREEQ
ncbi:MAG: hypothetical protein VB061_08070 [Christensenella sp.]|nr:hypothetical protein [Christensenella sp.]